MLKICILGSGSRGNATLIATDTSLFIVDVGLSGTELIKRLESTGTELAAIDGILITHEHTDHVRGLQALIKMRDDIPVYLNRETADALGALSKHCNKLYIFQTGKRFRLEDFEIEPFPVYHDAREPLGFSFHKDGFKAVLVTDIGAPSTLVKEQMRGADLIVVESNHDTAMLENGARPRSLKQRIKGRFGHLSNQGAAELLGEVASPRLRHVVLAHLSTECNRPELAKETVEKRLQSSGIDWVTVHLSFQDKVGEMIELRPEGEISKEESPLPVHEQLEIF